MVRLPTDADTTGATGVSRTVTVELLLMLSSQAATRAGGTTRIEHKQPSYAKPGRVARQRGQCPRRPGRPYPAMLYSAVTTDACPATERSWVKIPHGTATVSGERAPTIRSRVGHGLFEAAANDAIRHCAS